MYPPGKTFEKKSLSPILFFLYFNRLTEDTEFFEDSWTRGSEYKKLCNSDTHHEVVDNHPALIRKFLQVWNKKLNASIPVRKKKHTSNEFYNAQLATGDIEQL